MDLLQYTFFQHALIGSLLASIVCGLIGTYIVTRRLVFISGGLTHASFGGIGLGLYTGVSPILAAGVFAVLSAFGVEWLSKRNDMREDSAIAVFWTLGMALGIMFTFLSPGFAPDLSAYLFGNILTLLCRIFNFLHMDHLLRFPSGTDRLLITSLIMFNHS